MYTDVYNCPRRRQKTIELRTFKKEHYFCPSDALFSAWDPCLVNGVDMLNFLYKYNRNIVAGYPLIEFAATDEG